MSTHLSLSQRLTLKAAILADPILAAFPRIADGYDAIATIINKIAIPDFIVWRPNVSLTEIGNNFSSAELGGLTTANANRLLVVAAYQQGGVNASKEASRLFFDDIFSGAGGILTRAALLAAWKRKARVVEKILSTGLGTDASPATMTFEGTVSWPDVEAARNS